MMRTLLIAMMTLVSVAACVPVTPAQAPQPSEAPPLTATEQATMRQSARRFIAVVDTLEPVAETECRRIAPEANCDFLIVVDDRPDQPPNAFQTVSRQGQPILAFTLSMIGSVDNSDELAFVMGHEASHHILDHLKKTNDNAAIGATLFSGIAAIAGADATSVRSLERLGATVGARSYSKDFELEADQLGTKIALLAGYDPVLGAQYFNRIPDPGDKFLGTHPPNGARMSTVCRTARQMGWQGLCRS